MSKRIVSWLLIVGGIGLAVFSVMELSKFSPFAEWLIPFGMETVDQEGFAPVLIPDSEFSAYDPGNSSDMKNIPERIIIPEIDLDAPVVVADSVKAALGGQTVIQFLVPEFYAAGWHENSAPLGEPGNTVINGHHNAFDKVFENLVELREGSEMTLMSGDSEFTYRVARRLILPEEGEPVNVRLDNGRWILPSDDERVTLVTCWPKNANTHRLILVALPESTFDE